jgi:hypothetical protein
MHKKNGADSKELAPTQKTSGNGSQASCAYVHMNLKQVPVSKEAGTWAIQQPHLELSEEKKSLRSKTGVEYE